jgi:hypothetical protein
MLFFLTTLAALCAAFYIALPFWREASLRAPAGVPLRMKQRELEGQRESLLRELKDLEFDRRMGKVEPSEYEAARARLTQEAAQVLRKLEELPTPKAKAHEPKARGNRRLDLEIEIEVAVARARRKMKMQQASAFWECECGRQMNLGDRFCASCGQERPEQSAAEAPLAVA